MTVSPSLGCRPGLPDIARRRTYQVELVQNATRLQVKSATRHCARTTPTPLWHVLGSSVRLIIVGDTDTGEWTYPDFYDQLSPTETFGFKGVVLGTVNGREIRREMEGDLVYWNGPTYAPAWFMPRNESCRHAATLGSLGLRGDIEPARSRVEPPRFNFFLLFRDAGTDHCS